MVGVGGLEKHTLHGDGSLRQKDSLETSDYDSAGPIKSTDGGTEEEEEIVNMS